MRKIKDSRRQTSSILCMRVLLHFHTATRAFPLPFSAVRSLTAILRNLFRSITTISLPCLRFGFAFLSIRLGFRSTLIFFSILNTTFQFTLFSFRRILEILPLPPLDQFLQHLMPLFYVTFLFTSLHLTMLGFLSLFYLIPVTKF